MGSAPVQQHRRYKVNVDVDVRFAKGQVKVLTTEDLSLGGAFLCSKEFPPVGAELLLRLHTPGGVFTVDSRVVHALEEVPAIEKQRAAGFGVVFVALSPAAEEGMRQFLQQQQMDAWKDRAIKGMALARRSFRSTVDKVRAYVAPPDQPPDAQVPWYHRSRVDGDADTAPAPPQAPAAEQLKDLLALAKEHEGAGEFEEARHTWLCAQELVRKHPELGGLLDEAMLAGKN